MDLSNHIFENRFCIKVVPNASKDELVEENGKLKLYIKALPQKGKANEAVVKFFKKKYKVNVQIVKGIKSREKILNIL